MEFVEIHKLLEGHAAARASEQMSDQEIMSVQAINNKLLSFAKAGQLQRSMQKNQRFHIGVCRTPGSTALLESIEHLWLRVGPSINQFLAQEFARHEESLQSGFCSHNHLIDALAARATQLRP
jgi:DNA-binding GntR family transcriptional regulator